MNRNRKWKYVGKAVLSGVLVTSLLVGNIGYAEAKPISQMRGHLYEVQIAGRKVPAVVTYHPSYLLRNPVSKELGWHDILFAKKNVPQD